MRGAQHTVALVALAGFGAFAAYYAYLLYSRNKRKEDSKALAESPQAVSAQSMTEIVKPTATTMRPAVPLHELEEPTQETLPFEDNTDVVNNVPACGDRTVNGVEPEFDWSEEVTRVTSEFSAISMSQSLDKPMKPSRNDKQTVPLVPHRDEGAS